MNTQLLTGEDTRFLAQQPEYEVDIMVGQMTTLMQNITDLQNDTDDKVAQLQNQGWFKRMTNTLFGRNKATKQEIQKNNDKVMTYISQSVAQLYQMNLINERVICSLGNRMNEVYLQVTEMNQEMLTMKGQISQLMAVQQQTMEALGAFVNKLNEKIESVDNFHMMISEIQNGMYNDSSKLYNLCSILSQLDKRQMEDNRKMALLKDSMEKAGIITEDEITVQECLKEIIALPQEKIGLIYLELCNFRNSFPANLFADMIENYHFLSKMEKMSKKKEVLIQRVLEQYELDPDAAFSIADVSESFFESKQECLINVDGLQIGINDNSLNNDNQLSLEEQNASIREKIIEMTSGDNPDFNAAINFIKPLAEQGYAAAQNGFGICYQYGQGVEKNEVEAVKWYQKASEQGYAISQCNLGICYYNGTGVEKNEVEAVKWYRKAAEQGYARAQYNLGVCYDNGTGVEENEIEAVKWYRKAAEQGYADAQYNLGVCYDNGTGVEKNEVEAVKWYRKAAEQEFEIAQNSLGYCYQYGIGVEKNEVEAVKWYRKAAEQGYANAQCNLGYCYEYGQGVEKNEVEAVKWYQKAADQGNAVAQGNLGCCYEYGKGVEKNEVEAVKWYRKAADQGNAVAQSNLGYCYDSGNGVERNVAEAVKWYRKAADQGNARAQCNLGVCYQNGNGVERNVVEAVKWYRKAADQGNAVAQHNIGNCYYYGCGISKNNSSAKFWMKKAAEQGYEDAIEFLNENF